MAKRKSTQTLAIYKDKKGNIEFRADVAKDTIWATQAQIAQLFGVNPQAITKHLKNIYLDGELVEKATCSKMEQVQSEGGRKVLRSLDIYNLDAILSVGYRVNSKEATSFRVWATKTLKNYLIKGYAIHEKRLKESQANSLKELQKTLSFIQETIKSRQLDKSETDSLLSVIKDYTNSFILLNKYDEGKVKIAKSATKSTKQFIYEFVRPAIDTLKNGLMKAGEATELFGNERDESFSGIIKTIYQTFDGKELYGSLEEKAAHLLYFIIKDHPFFDGNKRVGAFLFVLFLDQNKILYRKNGERKINDGALVALALLIAQSNPLEKDQMVALITQLIK